MDIVSRHTQQINWLVDQVKCLKEECCGSGEVPADVVLTIEIEDNTLYLLEDGVRVSNVSLLSYLDNTNLPRIISGALDDGTGVATFTRDDNTTFDVDFSSLLNPAPITNTSELVNDGENGTDPFITEKDITEVPIYDSMSAAIVALGLGKMFRYSENNLDGVTSINDSIIGITNL